MCVALLGTRAKHFANAACSSSFTIFLANTAHILSSEQNPKSIRASSRRHLYILALPWRYIATISTWCHNSYETTSRRPKSDFLSKKACLSSTSFLVASASIFEDMASTRKDLLPKPRDQHPPFHLLKSQSSETRMAIRVPVIRAERNSPQSRSDGTVNELGAEYLVGSVDGTADGSHM